MRFYQSHTYYLSHMRRTWLWVLDWDKTDTFWNANRWRHILLDKSHNASMLRMSVNGSPHLTSLTASLSQAPSLLRWVSRESCVAWVLLFCIVTDCQGGNCDRRTSYIDLSNFCHFLRNNDSKYCFFSCKRCSLRLKRGHLFTFRATFIFLHRASKALSRAANSFMLVSWSRLLRNIHS